MLNGLLMERELRAVLFANTGLEEPETLDFVAECSAQWGVPVVWLEYRAGRKFEVVTHATASRDGRPFSELIEDRRALPNPVQRFCTAELKVRTMQRYLQATGMDLEGLRCALGIRADEPHRAARIKRRFASGKDRRALEPWLPLVQGGATVRDVHAFWGSMPFDLKLSSDGRKTFAGNCNLCFCKPYAQRLALIAERPDRAVWWIGAEASASERFGRSGRGVHFTKDTPPYAVLAERAARQGQLPLGELQAVDCLCGDDA